VQVDTHWWFGDSNNLAIWVNHAIFWQHSGNIVLRNILAIFSQYFCKRLAIFWQISGNIVLRNILAIFWQ
jgi:hypothetical protein